MVDFENDLALVFDNRERARCRYGPQPPLDATMGCRAVHGGAQPGDCWLRCCVLINMRRDTFRPLRELKRVVRLVCRQPRVSGVRSE